MKHECAVCDDGFIPVPLENDFRCGKLPCPYCGGPDGSYKDDSLPSPTAADLEDPNFYAHAFKLAISRADVASEAAAADEYLERLLFPQPH